MSVDLPTYTETEAYGVKLRTFLCEPYDVTLTVKGCAGRWTKAQGSDTPKGRARNNADRGETMASLDTCTRCPMGALHAGKAFIARSEHYGASICPRCSKGTMRMIGNRVCVSCYNREREMAAGKNARGNRPERLAPVHAITLRLVVDNQVRTFEGRATSTAEVVLQTLRTTRGDVAFAPRHRSMAAQMSLFG